MRKNAKVLPITTSFANSGRYAGNGIICDDYSENSGNPNYYKKRS